MNNWAWIGMLGIIIFTLLPLTDKKKQTREEIENAIVTVLSVIGIIVAVLIFNVNYLVALLFGFAAMIIFNRKTYTKKRLIIYGVIAVFIGACAFILLRENPNYVLNHLKEHPEHSSLYLAENGDTLVTYNALIQRPLASTVKIVVALEYAMQIEQGILQKNTLVSLDDLAKFYLKNSDGGAHEAWLETMKKEGRIQDNHVTLHDAAKGMVTYSSNANTEYFIHLLGSENINMRKNEVGLTKHDDIYPIVGALFISEAIQTGDMDEDDLVKELRAMPFEKYSRMAHEISKKMQSGEMNLSEETFNLSMKLQKVWSDRLVRASANDYGKLLSMISSDELPTVAAETMRDLMEWPMQLNEGNKLHYLHDGSKGGSTAFILNNARYVEDLQGKKIEMVYLLDQLNILESFLIHHNRKVFEEKLIQDEAYRKTVIKALVQ